MPSNEEKLRWLLDLRRLSNIPRCHTLRRVKESSVAEHSYYTMLLATIIAARKNLPITTDFLLACAFHDVDELYTGDIPFPVKHFHGDDSRSVRHAIEAISGPPILEMFVALYPEEFGAELKRLSSSAKNIGAWGKIIALADMMELVLYAHEEQRLGNTMQYGVGRSNCLENGLSELRRMNVEFASGEQKVFSEFVNDVCEAIDPQDNSLKEMLERI